MMPKRAFGTGKTISKNVVYSSFSRPESARRILSVIFGTASNICLHFVASFPLIYKTSLFYTPIVKKQCLISEQGGFHEMNVQHTAELFFSIYIMFLIKIYVKSEGVSSIRMYEEGLKIMVRGLCKS